MATTAFVPVQLHLVVCPHCGAPFAIATAMLEHAVVHQAFICCPSGHAHQLGVEPAHEQRIRQLETSAAQQGAKLVRVTAENLRLRATVVDLLAGGATAEGGSL